MKGRGGREEGDERKKREGVTTRYDDNDDNDDSDEDNGNDDNDVDDNDGDDMAIKRCGI